MTTTWFLPGSPEYTAAATPMNATADQRPAAVARPATTAEVAAAVRTAADRGLRVVPQSTGHGAAGVIGPDTVLLDTSGLDDLHIDPDLRTATVGAGLTWGRVNAEAERHGLLARSGSAPSVGVCGYTFGGGVGWLVRSNGMASAALRSVEYVTGEGSVRTAAPDAVDSIDRDALWAFRGGGGVGIATRIEIDLADVADLHAGYLLWPVAALERVVEAWAAALSRIGEEVATSISVLRLPDASVFPESVRGTQVVHLAVASPTGASAASSLLGAVRAAAPSSVEVWGPADAAALGRIHLDPVTAVPALGTAHWTTAGTPAYAARILARALEPGAELALVEIRNVQAPPTRVNGALTQPLGDFIVHAVAPAVGADAQRRVTHSLEGVLAAVVPVDTGVSVATWMDGSSAVPDAIDPDSLTRLLHVADRIDPAGVIARSRHARSSH